MVQSGGKSVELAYMEKGKPLEVKREREREIACFYYYYFHNKREIVIINVSFSFLNQMLLSLT